MAARGQAYAGQAPQAQGYIQKDSLAVPGTGDCLKNVHKRLLCKHQLGRTLMAKLDLAECRGWEVLGGSGPLSGLVARVDWSGLLLDRSPRLRVPHGSPGWGMLAQCPSDGGATLVVTGGCLYARLWRLGVGFWSEERKGLWTGAGRAMEHQTSL